MKKFILKSFLLVLPLLFFFLLPSIVLYVSGENFVDLRKALKENSGRQSKQFGYLYNEDNYGFIKWHTLTNEPRYDVVTMGSSRVLQFRKEMFEGRFYNAGFTVRTTGDFLPFWHSIPEEKYPRYLILGLDQNMFNENFHLAHKRNWDSAYRQFPKASLLTTVYRDLLDGKYSLSDLFKSESKDNLGINAKLGRVQFKNDGSTVTSGRFAEDISIRDSVSLSKLFPESFVGIENGTGRFAGYNYGDQVDFNRVNELEEFLIFCEEKDIYVIAFLTTMSEEFHKRLLANGKYEILNKIYPVIKPLFDQNNFELFNYTTPSLCDSDDYEMYDVNHASERIYQKILIDMLSKSSKLSEVADKEKLEQTLHNSVNRYWIYERSL